jgi:amicyanin
MKNRSSANILVYLSALMILGVASCKSQPTVAPKSPDGYEIKIDNFSFTSPTLTVPVGAKVTWTNRDDIPHTIVSSEQKFKSKPLDTDETFAFTFTEPGTYQYFCGLHPKMVGKVVVEAPK